ncbi:conserved protein of unknown function [Ruminococcaceae bacterium BL-6]|jgi:predicted house-cleaning noncanonical NTP pyrophosphatase (MazG superfamily)|nr:conserved protein of unknown function [Ruminococcaceae bacterium BL-6]
MIEISGLEIDLLEVINMSRGRKPAKPIAEQIKDKEELVKKLQSEITKMKKQEEEKELREIKTEIKESGVDLKEIIAAIQAKKSS